MKNAQSPGRLARKLRNAPQRVEAFTVLRAACPRLVQLQDHGRKLLSKCAQPRCFEMC